MLKLFDNCASLTFSRGNKAITGMTSSEVLTCLFVCWHCMWQRYLVTWTPSANGLRLVHHTVLPPSWVQLLVTFAG